MLVLKNLFSVAEKHLIKYGSGALKLMEHKYESLENNILSKLLVTYIYSNSSQVRIALSCLYEKNIL